MVKNEIYTERKVLLPDIISIDGTRYALNWERSTSGFFCTLPIPYASEDLINRLNNYLNPTYDLHATAYHSDITIEEASLITQYSL